MLCNVLYSMCLFPEQRSSFQEMFWNLYMQSYTMTEVKAMIGYQFLLNLYRTTKLPLCTDSMCHALFSLVFKSSCSFTMSFSEDLQSHDWHSGKGRTGMANSHCCTLADYLLCPSPCTFGPPKAIKHSRKTIQGGSLHFLIAEDTQWKYNFSSPLKMHCLLRFTVIRVNRSGIAIVQSQLV